jgi:hypothetical protein
VRVRTVAVPLVAPVGVPLTLALALTLAPTLTLALILPRTVAARAALVPPVGVP